MVFIGSLRALMADVFRPMSEKVGFGISSFHLTRSVIMQLIPSHRTYPKRTSSIPAFGAYPPHYLLSLANWNGGQMRTQTNYLPYWQSVMPPISGLGKGCLLEDLWRKLRVWIQEGRSWLSW